MSRLTVIAGDDAILDVAVTDDTTGDAVDLTGAHLWFMVKADPDDADDDAAVSKETGDGIEFVDADEGTATVTLDAADTIALLGAFYWELQLRDGTGLIRTLASGRFAVSRGLITST